MKRGSLENIGPTEVQRFITRKCNRNCGYCKLVEADGRRELNIEECIESVNILETLNIKTEKILGGEPTVKKDFLKFLEYLSKSSIKGAVLSNSSFDDDLVTEMTGSGLWGYFASVDGIEDVKSVCLDSNEKSSKGYGMLHKLKKFNTPLLAANVVINKKNLEDIVEIVQTLSSDGFYINLCPIQHTSDERKVFSKTDVNKDYMFFDEDRERLQKVCNELIQMKKSGVKISVPESYLEMIPVYGIHCDWQCENISQLRIDSDGGLMLCNEYRTELADMYNILNMTLEKYKLFLKDWKEVRASIDCDGCFWSCFFQAEENLKKGILEFDYADLG